MFIEKGNKMTLNEFSSICGELLIPEAIALEDEALVSLIKQINKKDNPLISNQKARELVRNYLVNNS